MKYEARPMTAFARALFAIVLGPFWVAAIMRRPLMPRNFHGCRMVMGMYPKNLPLLHRAVYSWWIMPMEIYGETVRETRIKLSLGYIKDG